MKAVEDPNGFDAWKALNEALKQTSTARGLALLGAATAWPAFSMNSALQPQLLKLEEVFDETVRSGTTIQEGFKSAILFRCVGAQLKSYLNLTISDNVLYSTLGEQVLQWERSQPRAYANGGESKMPKEQARRARMINSKGKGTDPKGNGAATCYTCGKAGHLAKDGWRNNIRQQVIKPIHLQEEHQ